MSSTTIITTTQSSPKQPVDDQRKVTENEQITNSTKASSKIDELLEEVIGDKKLNQLSLEDLNVLLSEVDFLDAIGLDTEGKKKPKEDKSNNGNNENSGSTSSFTSSAASSPTSSPTSSSTSSLTSSPTSSLTSSSTSSFTSSVSLPDLVGSFGAINLPSTVNFGAQGNAQVIVTNQGQAIASGPSTVRLYISTDGEIDSNDALLTSVSTNLNLSAGQSVTLNLQYQNNTSVIAPGAYFLIAQVDANNQIPEQLETNNVTSKLVSGLNTNAIIDWNAIALNAIQAEGKAGRGVPPTVGSRLMALVSTAVYDTVQAFNTSYPSYAVNVNAPANTSLQAAVVGAAYRVLSTQLPGQNSLFLQQVTNSLAEIQDSATAESRGFNFGILVANQSLNLRANDGSSNNTPFTAPSGNYVWRPETVGPTAGVALGANWGAVTPWTIGNIDQFVSQNQLDVTLDGRPDNPNDQGALYAQEIEEVRLYGGLQNTALTTTLRNADQAEMAVFFAYDRADTFRPYGHLNQIAQEIAVREGNTLQEDASLFAALNTALADAVIVAWKEKYTELQPRPDDVIAGGFAANDGIASTVGDPNWESLLSTLMGVNSPPFPDYMSGHSAMGGAFAGVMTEYFGENYVFSTVSQELPGVVRHFESFYEAGMEDALSRIYGGVHVREACIESFEMGLAVGDFVSTSVFQPIV
ncbi:phosphatase PAP2 family protein [Microcystis aeruginosa CS-558/01A06]|uniref:Phosphatase PAP2 family protein n=1 Tax=Microcystis aeruginosa BLCC-F108 TaxID=2755317 RepID=A0A841UXH1_MICAE|nr:MULTISPECIES: CARDB domain-containing protein [Microcystis]MBC1192746.1 phosphatase PAP2 family protein [Microcystis aeruginosa BLCC-F108]MCA2593214.1 phosphatase PAP2 family protein [Microcystis sp. M31BS1]MDB9410789.1 phosphatase PAP2 family protein [Microcystis aeruginosa CS-558/01A06]